MRQICPIENSHAGATQNLTEAAISLMREDPSSSPEYTASGRFCSHSGFNPADISFKVAAR
jgi:hypothetical protein